MKRFIKIFIVAKLLTICLISCNKDHYVHYIVEGRIIDKTTRAPVKDIIVSFNEAILPNPEDRQRVNSKRSPIGNEGWSDENGEFNALIRILETYPPSLLYIYDYYGNENGLYKDTTISVDFSNVPLTGTPSKNYKGDCLLNIGDVELEKIR